MRIILLCAGLLTLCQPLYAQGTMGSFRSGLEDRNLTSVARQLRDCDVWARILAAGELARRGAAVRPALPALVAALKDKNRDVRTLTVRAIGNIGQADVCTTRAVEAACSDSDGIVRVEAAAALVKMKPSDNGKPMSLLIVGLRHSDRQHRSQVLYALDGLGPLAKRAIPELIRMLGTDDPIERGLAMAVLRHVAPGNTQEAVPALIVLLDDPDNAIRTSAVITLGSVAPAANETVLAIASALADRDSSIRMVAAKTLRELGPVAKIAVPQLAKALRDPNDDVRRLAAVALGSIGTDANASFPDLMVALQDKSPQVSEAATDALCAIGPGAVGALPAMIDIMNSADPYARKAAVRVIGAIGAPDAIKAGKSVLAGLERFPPSRSTFWGAAEPALASLARANEQLLPVLLDALKNSTPPIRGSVVRVLGDLGQAHAKVAATALIEAIHFKGAHSVFEKLAKLGKQSPEVVTMLADRLGDDDEAVAREMSLALSRIGLPAVPALSLALDNANNRARMGAIDALKNIGSDAKAAVPTLMLLLKSNDEKTYYRTRDALCAIDCIAVLPSLLLDLNHSDEDRRWLAADAIGVFGTQAKEATSSLIVALRDTSPLVRQSAASALAQVAPDSKRATLALISATADDDPEVRDAAVLGLGGLRTIEAMDALVQRLESDNEDVRSQAVIGLIQITPAVPQTAIVLKRTLRRGTAVARAAAVDALSDLGEIAQDSQPAIVDALQDESESVRAAAAHALNTVKPATGNSAAALVRVLGDKSERVRFNAVQSLCNLKVEAKTVIPPLAATLHDESAEVRALAASHIGFFGTDASAAEPALIEALSDADAEVRHAAAATLGGIGPAPRPGAVSALKQFFADDDAELRRNAISSVIEIDREEAKGAVPLLIRIIEDKNTKEGAWAALSLEKLGPHANAAVPALIRRWQWQVSIGIDHNSSANAVKTLDPQAARSAGIE